MQRTRKYVTVLGSVLFFLVSMHSLGAVTIKPKALEHAREVVRRPDGGFDIVCIDGVSESRSQLEVQNGQVCTHISDVRGHWTLADGGIQGGLRMCDLDIYHLLAGERILKIESRFSPPCLPQEAFSEDCNGMLCNARMGEVFYSLDFSTRDKLKLERLDTGFTAIYDGKTGGGGLIDAPELARTEPLGGVADILQVSNDGGSNWLPVCDDSFDQKDAEVACRQMGYSGVRDFSTAISVSGHSDYGLDDLNCTGNEGSLFQCPASPWRTENCDIGEHVRLVCEN